MASEKKDFEGMEPLFVEATAEWIGDGGVAVDGERDSDLRRPFLLYVHPPDPHRLEIIASNFCSHTFDRVLTVAEFEDMRDDTGVGGSWLEFVDYFMKSLSSNDVKLLLDNPLNAASNTDSTIAKVSARKSKGMPRIIFSLNRLFSPSCSYAVAVLSLALYRTFKDKQNDLLKEKDSSLQLSKLLSYEKERNEELQKQLDAFTFKNKRNIGKSKASERFFSNSLIFNKSGTSTEPIAQQTSEMPTSKDSQPMKAGQRVVPAYRRAKTRGAVLQDTDDTDT